MYKNSRHKAKQTEYDLYADIEKIKSAFGDTARDVKGKAGSILSQSIEDAREKTSDMQDNVVLYIQKQPMKAVGIAMLAGAVFGFILHRK